ETAESTRFLARLTGEKWHRDLLVSTRSNPSPHRFLRPLQDESRSSSSAFRSQLRQRFGAINGSNRSALNCLRTPAEFRLPLGSDLRTGSRVDRFQKEIREENSVVRRKRFELSHPGLHCGSHSRLLGRFYRVVLMSRRRIFGTLGLWDPVPRRQAGKPAG